MSTVSHLRWPALQSVSVRLALVLCPAVVLLLALASFAQDAPLDSSEISRDLLYMAPSRAEKRVAGDVSGIAYVGTRFEYMRTNGKDWLIHPATTSKEEKSREKLSLIHI